MTSRGVGFALHPDEEFLDQTAPLLELVDYVEVAPETLWRTEGERFVDNGYRGLIVTLAGDKPFVAHGVGLGLGAASEDDARFERWLARIDEEHRRLQFRWYTDHAGAPFLASSFVQLPVPVPLTSSRAAAARARLCALRDITGIAGAENTAHAFVWGDALDEPRWLAAMLDAPNLVLLLDLMNVVVMARNLGFDARAYIDRLPLERVKEIHVAGCLESDAGLLPNQRTVLFDGHDAPVPDDVWALLAYVLPKCPALAGVTLERREGTLEGDDVALLRSELTRIRGMIA